MSTPAPTAAAPAAAPATPAVAAPTAPVTPVAPAPQAPAAKAAPADPKADAKATGRGSRIFNLLAEESASEPGKPKEPKTPPPAEPAAAAAPAASTPAEPADGKPIKATKKAAITKRPELPTTPTASAAAPAAAPVAPEKTDAEFEAGLVDEEKQLIADAEEAEKHLPSRKGLKEQTKRFIKEHQKYLEKNPDIDGDPDAERAYQGWLKKNRPSLSDAEQRTVTENRIVQKASRPFEERTQKLEHELFIRDEEPKIAQEGQRVVSSLNGSAMPKEILDFAAEHGVEAAKQQFADELKIHNTVVSAATNDYQELIRLGTKHPVSGRALASPVTDPSDPKFQQHQRLEVIVAKVGDDFKNTAPEKELVRDGKWFVTREEWHRGFKKAPDKYWTFTNKEIAERSLAWVPTAINQTIQNNREEMTRRGYERRKYVPPQAPAPAPQPTRSPAGPGSSPVPSPSGATPPAQTPGARLAGMLTQS